MSVVYGGCLSGRCVSVATPANDGGSCWADASVALFVYPEFMRAQVQKAIIMLRPYDTPADGVAVWCLERLLAAHGRDAPPPEEEVGCPRVSPSRQLYSAVCTALEALDDEDEPVKYERPSDGYYDDRFIETLVDYLKLYSAMDFVRHGAVFRPTAGRALFIEKNESDERVPLEFGGLELAGCTLSLRAIPPDIPGHSCSLVRCREDPRLWMLVDALGQVDTTRAWSRTSLTFGLADLNPFEWGTSPWGIMYERNTPIGAWLTSVLLYTPRAEDAPTVITAEDRARAECLENIVSTAVAGRLGFADMVMTSLAYPAQASPAWEMLCNRTGGVTQMISDLHKVRMEGFTPHAVDAHRYPGALAVDAYTALTGNPPTEDWAQEVRVLNRMLKPAGVVLRYRKGNPSSECVSLVWKGHHLVAAFYKRDKLTVFAVRCNTDHSLWRVMGTHDEHPVSSNVLTSGITLNVHTIDIFNGNDTIFNLSFYGENISFGKFDSVLVYV